MAPKRGLLPGLLLGALALAGCRQDMHVQPKYIPLRESTFFGDNRSARLPINGTVAQDQYGGDPYFLTGKNGKQEGDRLPFALTMEVLQRGQQRYNIYCTPCHSRVGDGNGMIAQRGYRQPPSFHDERLRQAVLGHFFDVMTNGYGAMPDYASQIAARDRWAISAYIRALQLSQHGSINDVPAEMRGAIDKTVMYAPSELPRSIDGKQYPEGPHSSDVPAEKSMTPQ